MGFNFGIFPDAFKIAAVTPVYKCDEKSKVTNYRPISVLSCLSKIIEKLIKVRLISFFEKLHVFYPYPYGFRSNHSTIHALLDITTTLYNNSNNKIFSCLIMTDLKKAFDTVSHERLLKLKHYGIRGVHFDHLKVILRTENNTQIQVINLESETHYYGGTSRINSRSIILHDSRI